MVRLRDPNWCEPLFRSSRALCPSGIVPGNQSEEET